MLKADESILLLWSSLSVSLSFIHLLCVLDLHEAWFFSINYFRYYKERSFSFPSSSSSSYTYFILKNLKFLLRKFYIYFFCISFSILLFIQASFLNLQLCAIFFLQIVHCAAIYKNTQFYIDFNLNYWNCMHEKLIN